MQAAIKHAELCKKYSGFLFYICNKFDDDCIIYRANRQGNTLLQPIVSCFAVNYLTNKPIKIPEDIMEILFTCNSRSTSSKAVYQTVVASMPEKVISLHLKKQKPNESCGSVEAKLKVSSEPSAVQLLCVEVQQPTLRSIPTGFILHCQKTVVLPNGQKSKKIVQSLLSVDEQMKANLKACSLRAGFSSLFK